MVKIIKKVVILLLILLGSYFVLSSLKAATIDHREVRLSDSRPSSSSIYDFSGDTTATTTRCIKVQFCMSADRSLSCIAPPGLNVDSGQIYDSSPYTWNVFHSTNWTYTPISGGNPNDFKLTYTTGENGGTGSSWVVSNITNPDPEGTFYAWIDTYSDVDCTGEIDNGVVAFAIVSGVEVSATVSESLTFSINGVHSDECPTTGGIKKDSTPRSIPFSTVNVEAFYDICQNLMVSTNASYGYDVTIGETDQLTSGSNQIPDGNCDGGCDENTAGSWATATNNGFGYCMKDQPGYGDAASTADSNWATHYCGATSQYFKINPDTGENELRVEIMKSNQAVSDDRSYIGFRLSVDAAQPAGTYTTTIVYVATPRY